MSHVDGLSRASLWWDHTGKPVFVPEILPVPDRCMRLVRVEIECFMPEWIVHKNTRHGFRVGMAMLGPIRRDREIHAINDLKQARRGVGLAAVMAKLEQAQLQPVR